MDDLRNPAALALARAAVGQRGSIAAAAKVCAAAGYRVSRSNLSCYLSNALDSVSNIEAAIVACFDRTKCPYLGRDVDAGYCRTANSGPVPTWDPSALDQRRCCQRCPNHPHPNLTPTP